MPGLGEDRRHGARAEQAFLRDARAAAAAAEQALAHLLDADREHEVVDARP